MYVISEEGYLTDHMGFHVSAIELQEVLNACGKALTLGNEERVRQAKAFCDEHYPNMTSQQNWEAKSGSGERTKL